MSLLMTRAAILAQGGAGLAPPVENGSAWELDVTRSPAGYTLADGNQSAVNTSGGSNYTRWVPSAKPVQPADGRRYWEVHCADGGAAIFDGYMGVISEAMRPHHDTGWNPISGGSIGWRGNGTLWSCNAAPSASSTQRLSGLPSHGAGDVLMFVLDPAAASLWIGKNGVWHSDPAGPPTWSAAPSPAFYPVIQGRNPGDGGRLRSLPSQFSYPVPPGILPLGFDEPDLRFFAAQVFLDLTRDDAAGIALVEAWREHGTGAGTLTAAQAHLYIETEIS